MTITVFENPGCVACRATQRQLGKFQLSFETVDLSVDTAGRERMKALGYTSAPVVEVTDGEQVLDQWMGYRPDKIKEWSKADALCR